MLVFLLAFVVLLIIGVPISISIGASAVLGCLALDYPLVVIGQKMVTSVPGCPWAECPRRMSTTAR